MTENHVNAGSRGNHKLLLVDDEAEFLEATAAALGRRGFDVLTARDGYEALGTLCAEHVDVVVLDVKMPGIDGVEVFERVRRAYPGLPVIMLTGHGTVQQAFETSRRGAFDYLAKPCDMERLAQSARRAATSRRAHVPAAPSGAEAVRLLLVDDEAELLDALSQSLARRGIRVTPARGGVAALEAMRYQTFDVAILDLKMPGIDGLDLLRRIKVLQPSVEVIVLTGHATVEEAVEGLREGAHDFLGKPQSVGELVRKVREAHELGQARRQAAAEDAAKRAVEGRAD